MIDIRRANFASQEVPVPCLCLFIQHIGSGWPTKYSRAIR